MFAQIPYHIQHYWLWLDKIVHQNDCKKTCPPHPPFGSWGGALEMALVP